MPPDLLGVGAWEEVHTPPKSLEGLCDLLGGFVEPIYPPEIPQESVLLTEQGDKFLRNTLLSRNARHGRLVIGRSIVVEF